MKRRSFLALLGLAPAAGVVAKELAKPKADGAWALVTSKFSNRIEREEYLGPQTMVGWYKRADGVEDSEPL